MLGHQTWRNDIVAGSTVDVMVYQDRISCWLLGKVVKVQDDYLDIEFEKSPDDYDTVLSRWSAKLAPAGSESASEDEWRQSTFIGKTDVECDSHDGKMWMEATVFMTKMDTEPSGRVIPHCYVAYRVYTNTGKSRKSDARGIYKGWG